MLIHFQLFQNPMFHIITFFIRYIAVSQIYELFQDTAEDY